MPHHFHTISKSHKMLQTHHSRTMVRISKLMPRFGNPSVAGPEFWDKCKCRRPKRERGRLKREGGRYVSKATLHFGNLCVYDPSALWKKPSSFWKKISDSRKKPSDLRRRRTANAFQKGVPNRGINFKDVYRMPLFAIQFSLLVHVHMCTNHLTTKRIHTQDHSVRNAVSVHEDRLSIHAIVNLLLERMPGSNIACIYRVSL